MLCLGWAGASPEFGGSLRTRRLGRAPDATTRPGAQAGRGAPPAPREPGLQVRRRQGAAGGRGASGPRAGAGVQRRRRAERLTVADARLLSASVRWCGSQRLRNFEVRILLRKVRGCRMTQTWMSPSCSSLYLIPLHSRRARRHGTAPIFVPSGAGTSPPSSGLVSSICRGSPPPPELLVRSMAGRAGEGAGGGERGCPGCRGGGAPRSAARTPPAPRQEGGVGPGAPAGEGPGRALARPALGPSCGLRFLLARRVHARGGRTGSAGGGRRAGRGQRRGRGRRRRERGRAGGRAGGRVSAPPPLVCTVRVSGRPSAGECAAGAAGAGSVERLQKPLGARAIGPRGVMCPPL